MEKHNIKPLVFILLFIFLFNCGKTSSTIKTIEQEKVIDTTEVFNETGNNQIIAENSRLCFALKTKSVLDPEAFNYQFIQFNIEKDNRVNGVIYIAYFDKDLVCGHIKGLWDDSSDSFNVTAYLIAEGEQYDEQRNYKFHNGVLQLGYKLPNGTEALLPKVTAEEYDTLFREYQIKRLKFSINTEDRSRLRTILEQSEFEFSESDLSKIKFLEARVELNHDFSSEEYLVYIMNPILCGSGGCNLYITNNTGKIISKCSVTRPPIYLPVASSENRKTPKGQWKDIYVFSQGMRRLVAEDGKYPSNPSVQPEIVSLQLTGFPDQYQLVLDYLD